MGTNSKVVTHCATVCTFAAPPNPSTISKPFILACTSILSPALCMQSRRLNEQSVACCSAVPGAGALQWLGSCHSCQPQEPAKGSQRTGQCTCRLHKPSLLLHQLAGSACSMLTGISCCICHACRQDIVRSTRPSNHYCLYPDA